MEKKQIKEKIRKVFLDELPRKGNTKMINWFNCKNFIIHFIYDDINGYIKIKNIKRENNTTILYIQYKDNDCFKISTGHFSKCQFKELLGLINHNYIYNVNDIIKDNKRNLKILEQFNQNGCRYYKYECLNCGYIGTITEGHLEEGKNCSICSHQKIQKDINSIWATDNELVKYFVNIEDSYKYTHYSEKVVEVKCPDCGNIRKISIVTLFINGFTCPKCGDGISMPNKMMFNILEQLLGTNNFIREYSPNWIGRRLYDFYFKVDNKEYIIEMDGGLGHGNDNDNFIELSAEETKAIDDCKDEQARLHGVKVIRINCHPSKFEFIKQNISKNEILNQILELNKINWKLVYDFTLTNKMKEAWNLWNNGYQTYEIANILKLNIGTITRYLNKGNELSICKYDGLQNMKQIKSKKIRCIEYNLTFNSVTECAIELSKILKSKCTIGGIANACTGRRKSYYKLHFEYI